MLTIMMGDINCWNYNRKYNQILTDFSFVPQRTKMVSKMVFKTQSHTTTRNLHLVTYYYMHIDNEN